MSIQHIEKGLNSPIKNKAYRLYFRADNENGLGYFSDAVSDFTWSSGISKDGGTIVTTTNLPVLVSTGALTSYNYGGLFYLDLTADEMNADVICVGIRLTKPGYNTKMLSPVSCVIRTQLSELNTAPTKESSLEDKLNALFQYFFGKRTVTASAETLYKDNGTDILASNTITDDSTTVTKGKLT